MEENDFNFKQFFFREMNRPVIGNCSRVFKLGFYRYVHLSSTHQGTHQRILVNSAVNELISEPIENILKSRSFFFFQKLNVFLYSFETFYGIYYIDEEFV